MHSVRWSLSVVLLLMVYVLPAWGQDVPVRTLEGHTNVVFSIAFSPDGRTLASGSWDRRIKLWDAATGREIRTFTGHTGWVRSVAFSPDGRTLASGSWDRTVKLWDVVTGRELRTLRHTNTVWSVAFSPDERTLASGGDAMITLWDVATGQELRTLTGHTNTVWSVAFSPDGTTLASGSGDRTIKLWDVATGREVRTLTTHTWQDSSVAFSPDGRTLASGWGRDIKLWDVATGRELRTLTGHTATVNRVAFSPDGWTLASGSGYPDNTIKLWDVATWRELRDLTGHTNTVYSVAYSPDGRTLASGSGDHTIKLWDVVAVLDPNEPPTARFTFEPAPARVNEWVTFDASGSHDPDGEIVRYEWDWNSDGTFTASTTDPVTGHRFTSAGAHQVTLRVTDNDGATGETTQTVVVEAGSPPVASFTVALHIEYLGLVLRRREVTFDASDSYDPDGEIVRYAWDFGDGNTAEGRIVTHTYPEAGTYTVRLTVTDDDGMTDTTEQEVQVVPGGGGGPGLGG